MKIYSDRIYIKRLTSDDAIDRYIEWMGNREVTNYLESKFGEVSYESIKTYVKQNISSQANFLMGIFLTECNTHIGNIKIGNINHIHRFADVGFFIGDQKMHGKGYATEALNSATKFAFQELNLNKLFGGCHDINTQSKKVFLRAGYMEAGVMRRHLYHEGNYVDCILFEKIKTCDNF